LIGGTKLDVVFKTDEAVFNYRVAGIWVENGHVLLHRAVNDNHWSLPGGRVAIAEESKSSIKREFLEELNVEIKIERLVWIVENFFNYHGKDFHEIGLYYAVISAGDSIEFDNKPFHGVEGERLVFKWIPINELKNVELYPEFLRTAISNLPHNTEHLVVNH
jgi:8-oxo-dGTP pyrophosphatase MutT (NUDIX family)